MAEQCARKSNENSETWAPIGDDIELIGESRADDAEFSEFPLDISFVCVSQMTVRCSVGFLVLQRKS